ncbi:hypothetical protein DKM44_12975 [Deinococcus irradiatisoli]|uniref:Uncharacterized protein n=1 Tax=Deinococcus irradiatisoli TaxID=2202254 RepID=A0A2Z3JTW8_9DEIO|nr:hypothetical protein [Deinococcus irradiatisoli]AWN24034.1 hypothetical protein DKM44_12975 [Deinococcus irradiatisoli]
MTAPAEVPAVLTREEERDHLLQISMLNDKIESFSKLITKARQEREEHEARLLASATATGQEIAEAFGYRVRWNKGRQVVTWDAEQLFAVLPQSQREVAIKEIVTLKVQTPVINALLTSGQLSEAAKEAMQVTPAQPRMVVEKVVPQ